MILERLCYNFVVIVTFLTFLIPCCAQAFDASNSRRETMDKQIKVQGILRFLYTCINLTAFLFSIGKNKTLQPK